MPGLPDEIPAVRQWLEKAEHDLITARHTLSLHENCPFDTVCFHAQQCAEKYLKSLLVARTLEIPRTHDLRLLVQRVEQAIINKLDISLENVLPLNRYAVETRYPGDWEPISRQEAEEAVVIAEMIRQSVRQHLPEEALL